MSALLYWKERLLCGMPFFSSKFYDEKLFLKPNRKDPTSPWPHAVARSAMYADYAIWHREKYLPEFQEQPHYQRYPEDLPRAADELGFFSTIGPWLYVLGKSKQVRSYSIIERVHQSNVWHDVPKKRYFVRLCGLPVHIAAFELYTGISLGFHAADDRDQHRFARITEAQQECRIVTEKNRASVPSVT